MQTQVPEARAPKVLLRGGTPPAQSPWRGGGLPLRYARDLRPLTAIPLLAGDTLPLHPPTDQECPPLGSIRCPTLETVPVGYPSTGKCGALRGTPRCAFGSGWKQ